MCVFQSALQSIQTGGVPVSGSQIRTGQSRRTEAGKHMCVCVCLCRGRTALAYAARHGLTPIVKLLVSKGADLLAVDNAGRVPRLIAHVHNHRDTSQVRVFT